MADKVEKPKKSKPKAKKDEKGVLAALPSTRPERIGGRRASAPKTFEQPQAAQAAARGAKKPAAAKPSAAPRATATRRKAAAPRTFEPTPAAEAAAGAADERAGGATAPRAAAGSRPRPAAQPRPRPVREGAPGMGMTGARERAQAPAERRRAHHDRGRGRRRAHAGRPDDRRQAREARRRPAAEAVAVPSVRLLPADHEPPVDFPWPEYVTTARGMQWSNPFC